MSNAWNVCYFKFPEELLFLPNINSLLLATKPNDGVTQKIPKAPAMQG